MGAELRNRGQNVGRDGEYGNFIQNMCFAEHPAATKVVSEDLSQADQTDLAKLVLDRARILVSKKLFLKRFQENPRDIQLEIQRRRDFGREDSMGPSEMNANANLSGSG